MPPVGSQLPPHLTEKRKRTEDDDASDSRPDRSRSSSQDSASKRQRTIGPTLPPAPLDERPASNPQSSAKSLAEEGDDRSSDDDDFGPALPTTGTSKDATSKSVAIPTVLTDPTPPISSQRDAWMLVPPSSGDWTARVDPTKLKARKFNTSKPGSRPKEISSKADDTWNETPQEKHARLQREMMGIKHPSSTSSTTASSKHSSKKDRAEDAEDVETKKRMKEYAAARGPSLYNAHQKKDSLEKPDDPSARAFDREKDIGGGLQINDTQRRDLLKKAGDFSSRFSSAKYL